MTSRNTYNLRNIHTRTRFPNNNGIVTKYMGMPSKDGPADNNESFTMGRKYYLQLNNKSQPDTINPRGEPIPNNNTDLYLQRKRLLTIGRGSITTRENTKSSQLTGGMDPNYTNRALIRAKSGGSSAPPRTSSRAPGISGPSIFARRVIR